MAAHNTDLFSTVCICVAIRVCVCACDSSSSRALWLDAWFHVIFTPIWFPDFLNSVMQRKEQENWARERGREKKSQLQINIPTLVSHRSPEFDCKLHFVLCDLLIWHTGQDIQFTTSFFILIMLLFFSFQLSVGSHFPLLSPNSPCSGHSLLLLSQDQTWIRLRRILVHTVRATSRRARCRILSYRNQTSPGLQDQVRFYIQGNQSMMWFVSLSD